MTEPLLLDPPSWPFSKAELTAGLRRATGDPTLQIVRLEEFELPHRLPAVGRIRGVSVTGKGSTGKYEFQLVLKEPRQMGTTLAGSVGPAARETLFYRYLAQHLPIRTPQIYTAAPDGKWLVMETLTEGRDPSHWQAEDYQRAVAQLLVLQDRFWGLGSDLAMYPWLDRTLDATLDVQAQVVQMAAERLLTTLPETLRGEQYGWAHLLPALTNRTRQIAAALHEEPAVLLHGDYWPGNIHIDTQGHLAVFDWQYVGIGPGILDLITLTQYTRWWYPEAALNPDDLVKQYREGLAQITGQTWTEENWRRLWGYGLLWVFLTRWLDVLSNTPASLLVARAEEMKTVWLTPIRQWMARLFPENS